MPAAMFPANERDRLNSLRSLRILDSARDLAFDSIVEIAARIFDVPIAAISLVDRDRQWFKSSVGLDVTETPRCQAFCAHAILNPKVELIVEDAACDSRFQDNPLVTEDPKIRFYAGVPLRSPFDDLPLGSLCVIDVRPRSATSEQLEMLRSLARQTEFLVKAFVNNRRLVEVSEELDQFAAAAAHDIKSPLRGIRYLADRVEEESYGLLPIETMQRVKTIQQRTDRLKRLLEDLLEYSKSAHVNVPEEPTDLRELISDIFADFSPCSDFVVDFSSNLGWVNTKRVQLAQILRNLIGNAVKHNERPKPRVEVEAKRISNETIQMVVRDNGPGISERHQQRVFNCFETLRSRDEVEGSGMGLAIVKRIVEINDCRIELRSKEDEGCQFTFTWPASVASDEVVERHLAKSTEASASDERRDALPIPNLSAGLGITPSSAMHSH